jgi:chitinase
VRAAGSDQDSGASNAAIAAVYGYTVTSGWPVETDFPSDHLSSWSSWAGLTPTTTGTTSTASATPTKSWAIAIYSDTDCSGAYYLVEGYNYDGTDDPCLVIADITTTSSDTDVHCGWYTNGGFSYTTCGKGTLTKPLSWQLTGYGAICTAYNTDTCSENRYQDSYTATEGCHNYSSGNFDTEVWVALKCGL